jgi:hypothetical protein
MNKSLYNKDVLLELTSRVASLSPVSERLWGKMNVAQMLAHCIVGMDVAMGRIHIKRGILGYTIGPLMKKKFYDNSEFSKNSPTATEFIIIDERDFNQEKQLLIDKITEFSKGGPEKCTTDAHAFFGKLTAEQWGVGMYKHVDHHLRQFGV